MVPSGTVTFLFTDIIDSTVLWDRHPGLMQPALLRHDVLLKSVFDRVGGHVFATGGDGFGVAFRSVDDALRAAADAQASISQEVWHPDVELSVRMGVHTGVAEERAGDYYGTAVNRAARVAAAAGARQVVLSAATAALAMDVGWSCIPAGEYVLKGFRQPEPLFCLAAEGLDVERLALLPSDVAPGNLPNERPGLVGRHLDVERLVRLQRPGSLVTLVGVGGVGKTRLALAVARGSQAAFSDGAWLVELGELTRPDEVAPAVATSLRLQLGPHANTLEAIVMSLRSQQRLIVLDNCEHVIDTAAPLVQRLRDSCPAITLLATSRELLGVDDETSVPIRPLGLEASDVPSDSARLFCERARAALGGFDPTTAELAVVEEMCRRLDGLPLAIELAAARLAFSDVQSLLEHLNDRFSLLTRRRGGVERQRSLRTTIAWSYDLLEPAEQLLFDRLSVFPADFDEPAVVAVCAAENGNADAGAGLASLVERSMLSVWRGPDGERYQQLESLRQFGEEQLQARGETAMVQARHMAHFAGWVQRADQGIRGPDEMSWHRRFLDDFANVRRAVATAVERKDGALGCEIVHHMLRWATTRHAFEVADWADAARALPSAEGSASFVAAISCSAMLAHRRADYPTSHRLADLARLEDDRDGRVSEPWAPEIGSMVFFTAGLLRSAMDEIVARAAGDPFWEVMAQRKVGILAWHLITSDQATEAEAIELIARSVDAMHAAEAFGNPSLIAFTRGNVGAALQRRDPGRALPLLEAALSMCSQLGAEELGSGVVTDLAAVYTTLGRPGDALALLGPSIRSLLRSGASNHLMMLLSASVMPMTMFGQHRAAMDAYGAVHGVLRSRPDLVRSLIPAQFLDELERAEGVDVVRALLDDEAPMTIEAAGLVIADTIDQLAVP